MIGLLCFEPFDWINSMSLTGRSLICMMRFRSTLLILIRKFTPFEIFGPIQNGGDTKKVRPVTIPGHDVVMYRLSVAKRKNKL